jgi:hypothetical protein
MVPEGHVPIQGLSYVRGVGFENAADDIALNEQER